MTDDIVTRLREKYLGQLPICLEAADEIERLRAERDEWRSIANQLVSGAERQIDDLRETLAKVDGASGKTTPSNAYWVAAWRRHDEAVRL
mgnify:CR=1 FL=1|jgi:hypothetical protein